ncbi:MAG: hypothetical protein R3261_11045 [Alphaproteobacteria bacterium]|nr:hypothetical protein [Alphaproteobacteria bacterium]
MESRIIKSLVVLGIPGISLGVFYLLLKSISFSFSQIEAVWSAIIAIIFILVVGGITAFSLKTFAPINKISNQKAKYGARDGFEAMLYFYINGKITGPMKCGLYAHPTPSKILDPGMDVALNLPKEFSVSKDRRAYWLEGSAFLDPDLPYRKQGVYEGHTLCFTDLADSELVDLAIRTLKTRA